MFDVAQSSGTRRERDQASWVLWRWWVAATIVGVVLGIAASGMLEEAISPSRYGAGIPQRELTAILAAGAVGSVLGAFIGAIQWTVLRRRLDHAGWWAPATIAGWCLAGVVAQALSTGDESLMDLAVILLPHILLTGVFQWLVLRREVRAAGRWLWGSAGALVAAFVATFMVAAPGMVMAGWLSWEDFASMKARVLFGLVLGPIYAVITGLVMVHLLPQRAVPRG